MILEVENWYLGYSQILSDCRAKSEYNASSDGFVHIFCNADADSLAAARILMFMLRSDGISYQLLPCRSYSQLVQHVTRVSSNSNGGSNVRAVILLNLGATRNLTRLFTSTVTDEESNINEQKLLDPDVTKVYVLDCRRPVHLANVHAANNVVVFWDVQSAEDVPSDGDNLSGNDSTSSSSSDDDDDSGSDEKDSLDEEAQFEDEEQDQDDDQLEKRFADSTSVDENVDGAINQDSDYDAGDENDGSVHGFKNKRRKALETIMDATLSESFEHENDDSESSASTNVLETEKVSQQESQVMTQREKFEDRRSRVRLYYAGGTFYGSPASFVAYRMATQLRHGNENADLLWLACVGVTDAYLHTRLDVSGYTTLALQLRSHVNRLFPNDDFDRVTNTVYAEQLLGNGHDKSNNLTRIGFSGNGRILTESDFRFFLLRHFSLFEAMVYSDYIATRFQLSTAKGVHRLQEMLAKMGFPLTECQQPFAYMKPMLRRQLQAKFSGHAEEYGLENFEFTSFFRITGYQSLLSASDTSYAVTALLEFDSGKSINDELDSQQLHQSFNLALDALNANSIPKGLRSEASSNSLVNGGSLSGNTGLVAGIRLAMKQQKCIMATAASLIDRTAITRLNHFRYAYITCSSQGEHGHGTILNESKEEHIDHIFAKPLTLTRLAHYLMDLHRENGKWSGSKARPLVLLAEKPSTQTFLVVGYEYPEHAGDLVRNRFGKNFELAAESMRGTFVFDSFDSNVIEVARGDVQRFIEQLHYLMETLSKSV